MLAFGLTVSLIGMGSVFIALILLVAVIIGISRIAAYYDKSPAPAKIGATSEPAAPDRMSTPEEEELAAVIAAALRAHSDRQ